MAAKIVGIVCLVLLPLSAFAWRASYSTPLQRRYDVTVYKSLRVYLKDGVCGLRLLTMPTKTAAKSTFEASLAFNALPANRSLLLTSERQGPYRVTWLVFPFWLTTAMLTIGGVVPLVRGPVVQGWRRWRGLCIDCGYDLTGNRSGRCPECGHRFR
jgi:hypothetical protein